MGFLIPRAGLRHPLLLVTAELQPQFRGELGSGFAPREPALEEGDQGEIKQSALNGSPMRRSQAARAAPFPFLCDRPAPYWPDR